MTPRTPVALILASAAGSSLILLVLAAVLHTVRSSGAVDLSPNYSATINSTLGVLIGSLATWVGATGSRQPGGYVPPTPPPAGALPPRTNPPHHGPRRAGHA